MLGIPIPYKYTGDKKLNVVVKGGTHPYRSEYSDLITQRKVVDKWENTDFYWVEDWVEEVYFILGDRITKYKTAGRDVFIGYKDHIQRMEYIKTPYKEHKASNEFKDWWKLIALRNADNIFSEFE